MLKVLIKGGGFANKGAEAMLLTVKQEISKRINDVHFCATVLPSEMELCKKFGIEAYPAKSKDRFDKLSFPFKNIFDVDVVKSFLFSADSARQIKAIKNCDIILDVSGYTFGDPFGDGPFKKIIEILKYCKKTGKKYIFLPQSWGPFETSFTRKTIKFMGATSYKICARDSTSLEYLKKEINSKSLVPSKIMDIAFKFEPDKGNLIDKILNEKGICPGKDRIIGIIPNAQLFKRMGEQTGFNPYIKNLIEICRFCSNSLEAKVILLPHATLTESRKKSDHSICEQVFDSLENKDRIVYLNNIERASEIKAVIGKLDLLISSRFHSIIAALSMAIPVIALSWSHKYPQLLGEFGLSDYCLDISSIESGRICELIKKAWENRFLTKEKIAAQLLATIRELDVFFDQIANDIRKP